MISFRNHSPRKEEFDKCMFHGDIVSAIGRC
jgi:hypothetical protein